MKPQRTIINTILAFVWLISGEQLLIPHAAEDATIPAQKPFHTFLTGQALEGLSEVEWWKITNQMRRNERELKITDSPIVSEITKLTASDGLSGDALSHVSVDGDTVVVGALLADIGINIDQGSAYVFSRNQGGTNEWGFVKKLTAPDGAAGDIFGVSVSISGDTIVIGASEADIGSNIDQGSAYVFYRNQGGANNWGFVKKLIASDGGDSGTFGTGVSINGDVIAIGAPVLFEGEPLATGAAYIFHRNLGGIDNWGEAKKLTASDSGGDDLFGLCVSVSGDVVVVGAELADVGDNLDFGAAYVYSRNLGGTDNWGELKKLTASDGASMDAFGRSVAVDGDTAVVGAFFAQVGSNTSQGAAYVFDRNQGGSNNWGEVIKLTASDGAAFDRLANVAISGDMIIAGARRASVGENVDQGTAYIFMRDHGGFDNWGEVKKLVALDGASGDRFGDVAVSGNILVVGAPYADVGENDDQGAAYVFYGMSYSIYLPILQR